jgi:hypothetical protein
LEGAESREKGERYSYNAIGELRWVLGLWADGRIYFSAAQAHMYAFHTGQVTISCYLVGENIWVSYCPNRIPKLLARQRNPPFSIQGIAQTGWIKEIPIPDAHNEPCRPLSTIHRPLPCIIGCWLQLQDAYDLAAKTLRRPLLCPVPWQLLAVRSRSLSAPPVRVYCVLGV